MSKKLIATILISSAFVSLVVYGFYQTFYQYQSDVDQILAKIPAEDKELPPNLLKVLRNTQELNGVYPIVTTNILLEINAQKIKLSHGDFNMYHFIWLRLLPLRIGEKEVFGFYTNRIYFKKDKSGNDIDSFKKAAKFYFNKDLTDLTEAEILKLLVYAQFPNYPGEIFDKKLWEITQTYQRNSAKSF